MLNDNILLIPKCLHNRIRSQCLADKNNTIPEIISLQ